MVPFTTNQNIKVESSTNYVPNNHGNRSQSLAFEKVRTFGYFSYELYFYSFIVFALLRLSAPMTKCLIFVDTWSLNGYYDDDSDAITIKFSCKEAPQGRAKCDQKLHILNSKIKTLTHKTITSHAHIHRWYNFS